VTATMTYVGLDVHARSTHAAAIDVASGELRRARFGGGSDQVIGWLRGLPQPLRGCYEAGPTGFALYRAAEAAGLRLDVVAPSKTPRAPGDRIKSDRKDAELLARLLLAGQLKPVAVPAPPFEAARHLARAREQVRGDLMRGRHRVSKLLLLHGRVYERSLDEAAPPLARAAALRPGSDRARLPRRARRRRRARRSQGRARRAALTARPRG
jgi:transposase